MPVDGRRRPAAQPPGAHRRRGRSRGSPRPARAYGDDVRIFVAYADCGTGGALDSRARARGRRPPRRRPLLRVLRRLARPSRRCRTRSSGTFYLTDFLARHFDDLVLAGLGLDRHPELLPDYFGNYRRLVYLAQTDDPALTAKAEAAAARLGLAFERRVDRLRRAGPGHPMPRSPGGA